MEMLEYMIECNISETRDMRKILTNILILTREVRELLPKERLRN